jgi:uncharacterized membrane protein
MSLNDFFENVGKTIDGVGVGLIALGAFFALVAYTLDVVRRSSPTEDSYRAVRRRLGRSILLGLELLVAGDIVRSVAVSPSFRSVGVLAIIVVIRAFLSMTLEVETSGRLPWQRAPGAPVNDA